jgi:hypothetical protein
MREVGLYIAIKTNNKTKKPMTAAAVIGSSEWRWLFAVRNCTSVDCSRNRQLLELHRRPGYLASIFFPIKKESSQKSTHAG